MGRQPARMRSGECGMRNDPYRAGCGGLSYSSTGYGGDSPLWLGHLLVLLTPYCLFVIGFANGRFLLMRGRRLKIFCSTYIMTLVGWNGTGFGVFLEKSPKWVIGGLRIATMGDGR